MKARRCTACGRRFQPHPQISLQCYCSTPECQRERRRRWRQAKRRDDPDYLGNDSDYYKEWATRRGIEIVRTYPTDSTLSRLTSNGGPTNPPTTCAHLWSDCPASNNETRIAFGFAGS